MEKIMVFVSNGILTNPGFHKDDWDDWLGSKIEDTTPMKAKVISYFCDAIFKQAKQKERISILAAEVRASFLNGYYPILVGHSNGAAIDCGILLRTKIPIFQMHLFSGACHEDCRKNGINNAFMKKKLRHAFCYCSKEDEVLRAYNSWFLNPVYRGLGYGFMGYAGPQYACNGVDVVWRPYGHCGDEGYWGKKHREQTWELFMENLKRHLIFE